MMGSVATNAGNGASGLLVVRGDLDDAMKAAGAAEVLLQLHTLGAFVRTLMAASWPSACQ